MMHSSHPLTLHIREIKQLGDNQISTINIGNLTPDIVKSLVAEAMGMEGDEDVVSTLATTVHQKTDGNAFFVLMFLRALRDQELRDQELLQYNFGSMMWMWDDEEVKSQLVTQSSLVHTFEAMMNIGLNITSSVLRYLIKSGGHMQK